MRRLLILVPLLFLGGCGALSNAFLTDAEQVALTPAARVFQMQSKFNILLQQVNVCGAQPFCSDEVVVACADGQVVAEAALSADSRREANAALRAAQTAVRAGSTDTMALAVGARIAVAQLSGYLITKGVAR